MRIKKIQGSLKNKVYLASVYMICLSLSILPLTSTYSADNTLHEAAKASGTEETKALVAAGARVTQGIIEDTNNNED